MTDPRRPSPQANPRAGTNPDARPDPAIRPHSRPAATKEAPAPGPGWIPPMEFDPARAVPAPVDLDSAGPLGRDVLEGEVLPPAGRKRGRFRAAKLFAGSVALLVGVAIGFDTVDMVARAFAFSPLLGGALTGLAGIAVASLGVLTGREWRAFARLRKVDGLRMEAAMLRSKGGHGGADPLLDRVQSLYAGRADLDRARAELGAARTDAHDDRDVLDLAERTLLSPLDSRAYRLVLAASRDTAIATALSPAAVLDVAIVLWRNMKLVREIATLYAARPGLFGSARLVRRMAENIGAAGLADASDSLVTDALGGTLAASISARLGQGVINGLLTARIGLTAMHLCRPLPFGEDRKPKLADIRKELMRLPREVL